MAMGRITLISLRERVAADHDRERIINSTLYSLIERIAAKPMYYRHT